MQWSALIVDLIHTFETTSFIIDTDGSVAFHIMGVDKSSHHLLLFARDNRNAKYRFLCGLDEKGWFAAAVLADRIIYPTLIGSDVGCGVELFSTDLKKSRLKTDKWIRQLKGIDGPYEGDLERLAKGLSSRIRAFEGPDFREKMEKGSGKSAISAG